MYGKEPAQIRDTAHWAELFNNAMYVEGERVKNTAEMLARLFGAKKKK